MRTSLFCLAAALLLTASPARASLVFDFQDHQGTLGNTQVFSAKIPPSVAYNPTYQITANGLTFSGSTITGTTDLFVKNDGGDENGLGTEHGSDHEIVGNLAVDINLAALEAKFNITSISFKFGSVTGDDSYALYAGTFGGTPIATGTHDDTVTVTGPFANDYFIKAPSGNILLDSITINGSAVPEPASLAMTALGVIGGLAGYRIKRRKAAAA